MSQNEKKPLKEKIKEKWERTKEFCSDHKEEIAVGVFVTAMAFIGIKMASDSDSDSSYDDGSDDDYSLRNLSNKSYDELNEIRENVRMDYQNEQREDLLDFIDKIRNTVGNPREKYARSLSDDDLESELEKARNLYYEENEAYKRDKRPYAEKRLDEDYKQHSIDYDTFYQLNTEKQRRYAAEHPDKFPVHSEHGWYLPEDDD